MYSLLPLARQVMKSLVCRRTADYQIELLSIYIYIYNTYIYTHITHIYIYIHTYNTYILRAKMTPLRSSDAPGKLSCEQGPTV